MISLQLDSQQIRTKDIRLTARQRAREHAYFERVRRAEMGYATSLRKIARHVGEIIRSFAPGEPGMVYELTTVLSRYADILYPWARSAAARMIAEVARRDATAWHKASEQMGRNLRREISEAPIGDEVRRILADQVHLIRSIPLEAAQRVQQLTQEYISGGRRYNELVPMIMQSGNVSISRATLIARTETAKTSSALTQARAKYIGSDSYQWMSVKDRDVRPMHKKLHGHVFRWDDPPIAETSGQRHHPGEFPNCRCWASPIIPDIIQ